MAVAHAALIASDSLSPGRKVVVLAATDEFLSEVELEINEIAKTQDKSPLFARLGSLSSGDTNTQIILALPSDKSKLNPTVLQLAIVCELNAIIRSNLRANARDLFQN